MNFHLVHLLAGKVGHGLHGYDEIIECVRWGLGELGHSVTYAANRAAPDRTNIVFGAQMLGVEDVARFPADTIVYNLEQIAGVPVQMMRASFRSVAERFQIWDYNSVNIDVWRSMNPVREPMLVPVGYAPILRRIAKPAIQDIDVLFYGLPTATRVRIFSEISQTGAVCVFICGLYGSSRDGMIARSKIILNINKHPISRVFEIARVSYLLANEKAVVSDIYPDSNVEPELMEAVAFAPLEKITETCGKLLNNEEERVNLEVSGERIFRGRDVRQILRAAVA